MINPYEKLAYNELEELIPKTFSYLEVQPFENGIKTKAKILDWIMIGEDTYITYTYFVKDSNSHLLFAWITPFDERHRAWGNHPKEWYDELRRGVSIEVLVDPTNFTNHRVVRSEFEGLNQGIIFVDKS